MVAFCRAAELLEMAAHPVGGVGIERGGGLVEQQNVRRVDQRLGERDAGLLPGRELADRPVEELRQIEIVGQRRNALGEAVDMVEPAEHRQILPHGQPVRHVDVGALEIHPVQHLVALARHLGAQHPNAARRRRDEPQDHRDGGGLAGAVAAQEPGDRAGRQRKRNAVDRPSGAVDLHQLVDGDGGLWTGTMGSVGSQWQPHM